MYGDDKDFFLYCFSVIVTPKGYHNRQLYGPTHKPICRYLTLRIFMAITLYFPVRTNHSSDNRNGGHTFLIFNYKHVTRSTSKNNQNHFLDVSNGWILHIKRKIGYLPLLQ